MNYIGPELKNVFYSTFFINFIVYESLWAKSFSFPLCFPSMFASTEVFKYLH